MPLVDGTPRVRRGSRRSELRIDRVSALQVVRTLKDGERPLRRGAGPAPGPPRRAGLCVAPGRDRHRALPTPRRRNPRTDQRPSAGAEIDPQRSGDDRLGRCRGERGRDRWPLRRGLCGLRGVRRRSEGGCPLLRPGPRARGGRCGHSPRRWWASTSRNEFAARAPPPAPMFRPGLCRGSGSSWSSRRGGEGVILTEKERPLADHSWRCQERLGEPLRRVVSSRMRAP